MDRKIKEAYVMAISYAFFTGLSFLFVKIALAHTDPLNLLAHRFTIAFCALSAAAALGWLPLRITKEDFWQILPLSIFYPISFFAFQTFGLLYVSSSETGIIQATIPIFTLFLSTIFLKEQTSLIQKLSLLLSVFGVIYIFAGKGVALHLQSYKGILFILLSTFSFACYNVLVRKKAGRYGKLTLAYIVIGAGCVFFNLLCVLQMASRGNLHQYFMAFRSPAFLGGVLYLGIMASALTAFLSVQVLQRIEASRMSVFVNLSTLVTILAGVIILKEELQYFHVIGTGMILLGVLGTNITWKKNGKSNEK